MRKQEVQNFQQNKKVVLAVVKSMLVAIPLILALAYLIGIVITPYIVSKGIKIHPVLYAILATSITGIPAAMIGLRVLDRGLLKESEIEKPEPSS